VPFQAIQRYCSAGGSQHGASDELSDSACSFLLEV
jgi:hypothetical protein